ncbi:transcriptional regulator family: Fungal Specific TF [Trichoderma harzianum]|nr:transcriptional regulator family: Fungal Specific TF [Trichoderma harzianum]
MATAKACVRCHGKKIRCSGYPRCRTCDKAGVNCEPYTRHRKGDSLVELKYYRQRALWLEDEVYRNFHIQCKDIPTGTLLQPVHDGLISGAEQGLTRQPSGPLTPSDTRDDIQDAPAEAGHAADIGMLALNATGEMRYLGPSSGAFFAAYTSALARSCITTQSSSNTVSNTQNANSGRDTDTGFVSPMLRLSSSDVDLFSQSYKMWILPVYPILTSDDLDKMVSRYNEAPGLDNSECRQQPEIVTEMMLFYLVMALGAINAENTLKQMRGQPEQEGMYSISTPRPSPVSLCMRVLQLMDENFQKLHPSVRFIQIIVLISIYSSYGSIGSSQWQLAGLAMRMAIETGLHCTPKTRNQSCSAKDESSRLFWTIYVVEISLAYNLGRPPSIGEEHIATELPRPTNENLLSLHHIRHRQIQSRVVAEVYSVNNRKRNISTEQTQTLISNLQQELDEWRINIPLISQAEGQHPYPYRNCSICLAIMNERLREDLVSKLDSQFELLANDTLRIISASITSHTINASSRSPAFSANPDVTENALGSDLTFTADTSDFNLNLAEDLNYFDIFKEFMGQDPTQTFWDMFPYDLSLDAPLGQLVTEEGLPSINSTELLTNELFK